MGQLRSFAGYAKVAPYSPFAIPCFLVNLDGYAAAAGWLQIHDKTSAPSAGAVPLKSVNVAAAGPLSSLLSGLGTIPLKLGLQIAMSSTETTYTAVATAFDAWGEVEEFELLNKNALVLVGDRTTAVKELQVILDGDDYVLQRLYVKNVSAGTRYFQLFANDAPADGTYPLMTFSLGATNTKTLFFGNSTRFSQVSPTNPNTQIRGLYICCSSTAETKTLVAANDANIEAQVSTP